MSRRGRPRGTSGHGRITPWQVTLLLVTIGAGEESTVVNRLLTPLAGRDLWISVLLAVPATLAGVAGVLALARRFPGQDLATILRRLLGPAAYPLGVAYVLLFLASAAQAGSEFAALSHIVYPATPTPAFLAPLFLAALYGMLLGIEVMGRVNTAFLLLVDIPLGLLLAAVFVGQQHLGYVLPILANGLRPVLSGAQLVLGTWGQFVLLLVYLPLTGRPEAAGSAAQWGALMLAVMALGHNLGPVLVFGEAVTRFTWPTLMEVRVVEVGRLIQRLDVVAIWLWVHSYWLQIAIFVDAAALTLAGLFRLRSHRPLLVPLAAFSFGLALLVPDQAASMRIRWILNAWAFLAAGFVLPPLLLAWDAVRASVAARHARARPRSQPT